ncbi:hypothetical protein EY643_02360 [Halioglobus maricola]|uniref:GEVED domain-containing protein n=1 Tax=Halioglobus maricola TaxID=2601894 RepID=A0A5P9NGB2_9GAMM|nr:GEVED domain-containing protein [Halioglobus maricola]QFU74586.1 hypothetical protein EY643_02360 [Halioglobus maricola]
MLVTSIHAGTRRLSGVVLALAAALSSSLHLHAAVEVRGSDAASVVSANSVTIGAVDIVAGLNRMALVGISLNANAGETLSSVTYSPGDDSDDSADQLFSCNIDAYSSDSKLHLYICYLPSPTVASNGEISAVFSASLDKGAVAGYVDLAGVDLTDPIAPTPPTNQWATAGDSILATVNVDAVQAGGLAFNVVATEKDTTPDEGVDQVRIWRQLAAGSVEISGGAAYRPNAGGAEADLDVSWQLSPQKKWAILGVALNPAAEVFVPGTDYGDAAGYGDAGHQQRGLLETLRVPAVTDDWEPVALRAVYDSPVVVCARNLVSDADTEAVVRVDNVTGTSFDVRLQVPSDQLGATASDVYCLVAEEGDYDLTSVGGPKFEAHTVLSIETNGAENFFGWDSADTEDVTSDLAHSYTAPVVLGQVMSFNESRHSQFWAHDCSDYVNPPVGAGVCVGKHVGKDTDTTDRGDETLGYIVFESAGDVVNDRNWVAAVGGAQVAGVDNNPPYSYGLSNSFASGTVTQTGMQGEQGGIAVLYGGAPLAGAGLDLAIDEDTIVGDRIHTQERVAYFLMQTSAGILLQEPYMGFNPGDLEDPQSDVDALADDNNDSSLRGVGSDEDGVIFGVDYGVSNTLNATVRVHNPTSGPVNLCGWMDDPALPGAFEPAEGRCISAPMGSSDQVLSWAGVPENGSTYLRFRVTSGALDESSFEGLLVDGEAEDYLYTFTPPPLDYGDAPESYGDASHIVAPLLETLLLSGTDDSWMNVELRGRYTAPVVVCTPHFLEGEAERVARVRAVTGSSFEMRMQQPQIPLGPVFDAAWDASCLIIESGDHVLPDGRRVLADTVLSGSTNGKFLTEYWDGSAGEDVAPTTPFTRPVVLGQVMTAANEAWSVFWANNCSNARVEPVSGSICVGKHIGEDSGGRLGETLGYVIVEAGSDGDGDDDSGVGSADDNGHAYEIFLSAESVVGVNVSPPYAHNLGSSEPMVTAVASINGMRGVDGGSPVLFGPNPVAGSAVGLAAQEDTINDTERNHIAERVAGWAFDANDAYLLNAPFLGVLPPDTEDVYQFGAQATDDDLNDADDEDGVVFQMVGPSGTVLSATVTVSNFAAVPAYVCGWLDVPGGGGVLDGVFDSSDLGAVDCHEVAPGTFQGVESFSWSGLPAGISQTYARFRISTDSLTAASAVVRAADGEVEDYYIRFDTTAVTLGQVGLAYTSVDTYLQRLAIASAAQAEAILQRWDEAVAADLEGASRETLEQALTEFLDPDGDGDVAVFGWETLSERDTIGFYVERRPAASSEPWYRVNTRMLPGLITAPMGGEYLLADPGARPGHSYDYRLIEQEAMGGERHYGPFRLNADAPGH